VSAHRLFAILVAFALLFAPSMTTAAMGGPASGHQMPMMDRGSHCQMPVGGSSDHHKSDAKSCCVWMCMALAVRPQSAAAIGIVPQAPPRFSAAPAPVGYLGEIATPPPRNA
jgi:hypothetical protein